MSLSCMGKDLPKEKQFGVKVCRERKCKDLQRDPEYPDSPQMCAVTHGMPGAMSMCVKEMDDQQFIRHISGQLNSSPYNAPRPGIKNCPEACPYKVLVDRPNPGVKQKKMGICALTGNTLGEFGTCPCNVLGNPLQEDQIRRLQIIVSARLKNTDPMVGLCNMGVCPDGKDRGAPNTEDDRCPVIRLPYGDINPGMGCPLWRIPAKLLPVPAEQPAIEAPPKATPEPEQNTKKKPAPIEKKRAKKREPEDLICTACRERFREPVPDHACAWCKEEQEKKGRRAWTTSLQLGQVHLGDMNELGKQVPAESIDLIFTDPAYVKDQYQQAYADLAELALRVLKPNGFLITYAPQTHLDEIMDMLKYTGTWLHGGKLQYFWIISSLNEGKSTAKNHQRNAICLHKPILVFQKAHDGEPLKGSRRCFADVVRGRRQKKFHPWQQSMHDVLGIISRFMDPGEILLDPYAGTGTSLIAANLLGMEWIGFEIDPNTYAIAVRELQQQPLALDAFGIEAGEAPCEREAVTVKDTSKQAVITKTGRPSGAGTGGGPQPFVQHCCGTCGHHKGRKTFHESCPRLGELLFKGGTKSARVLMDETAAIPCEHWTDIPGDLYAATPEKPDCGGKRPAISRCPDNCPEMKIVPENHGREKNYPQGRCGVTGEKLREMKACPNDPPKKSRKSKKKEDPQP